MSGKIKLSLQGERTLYFDSFHALFPNIPASQARQIWVSSIETMGEWMTRTLAVAEMPEIDHRISQAFHGIVQLTEPFKAQQ